MSCPDARLIMYVELPLALCWSSFSPPSSSMLLVFEDRQGNSNHFQIHNSIFDLSTLVTEGGVE